MGIMALLATVSSLSSGGGLHFRTQRKAANRVMVTPIPHINTTAESVAWAVEPPYIGTDNHSTAAFRKNQLQAQTASI